MRRPRNIFAVVALCLAMVLGIGASDATAAPGPTPPPRNNSSNETVYLVKGFYPGQFVPPGISCPSRWDDFTEAMRSWGWAQETQFRKVGFYRFDTGCDVNLARFDGTRDVSLQELGRRLAWDIYDNYSSKGKSVDLVGHSMGGLIVRAALLGVKRYGATEGWPDYIFVEDAVTLGTPHHGLRSDCWSWSLQCKEMQIGSGLINWLQSEKLPQSAQGTDWTLIGSNADTTVGIRNFRSAAPTTDGAQHLVRYDKSEKIDHSELRVLSTGAKSLYYSNFGSSWKYTTNGAPPVRAASHALYWESRW